MNINYPIKEFYTLVDLVSIVDIKYRMLLKRVKIVNLKYNDDIIYKKSNKWFIHRSIIKEFMKHKFLIDYELYATISSEFKFDIAYWRTFVNLFYKELKSMDKNIRLKYVIEWTDRNSPHLHFITTYNNIKKLRQMLHSHYITSNDNGMNKNVQYIWLVDGLHKYFRKQNKPVLLR